LVGHIVSDTFSFCIRSDNAFIAADFNPTLFHIYFPAAVADRTEDLKLLYYLLCDQIMSDFIHLDCTAAQGAADNVFRVFMRFKELFQAGFAECVSE
jgi:hypothetical protein